MYFRRAVFVFLIHKLLCALNTIASCTPRNKLITVMCQVKHIFSTDINEIVIKHGEMDRTGFVHK